MSPVKRVRGVVGAAVVAVMALSATACFAPPPDDADNAAATDVSGSAADVANTTTGTTQQSFSYWGDGLGAPTPLDHPIPSFKMPKDIAPPAPPDLDLFNEPYQRLESPGCYIKTVAVFDPSRGNKIEILVTVCN